MNSTLKKVFKLYTLTTMLFLLFFTWAYFYGISLQTLRICLMPKGTYYWIGDPIQVTQLPLILTVHFLAIIFYLFSLIASMTLLYFYWDVIKEGAKTRIAAWKAVAFLLIPFFNLYWSYRIYIGLSEDMQAYCRERDYPCQAPNLVVGILVVVLTIYAFFSPHIILGVIWGIHGLKLIYYYQGYCGTKSIYQLENK